MAILPAVVEPIDKRAGEFLANKFIGPSTPSTRGHAPNPRNIERSTNIKLGTDSLEVSRTERIEEFKVLEVLLLLLIVQIRQEMEHAKDTEKDEPAQKLLQCKSCRANLKKELHKGHLHNRCPSCQAAQECQRSNGSNAVF